MDAEKKDRIETVDCVDQAININDNEANSFDDEKTTSGYDMNTESTDPIGSHTSLPVAPKRKHKSDSSVIKTVRFALDSDYSRDETVEPINGQNFETTSAENDQKNNAANSHLPKVLSDQSQEFIDALSKKLLKDKRKFDGVPEPVQTSVPSKADNFDDLMPKVIVHRITFDTPVKNHSFYEKKNELNVNNASLLKSKIGIVQNSNQKNEEIDQKDKTIVHKIRIENAVEESKKISMQTDTNGKDVKDLSTQENEPPKNVEPKCESKIGVYNIKIEIPSESSPKNEIKASSETEKFENIAIVHNINVETKVESKNKIDASEGVKNEPNSSKTFDKEAKIVVHKISMEANNGNNKIVKDLHTKKESNVCAGQEKVIVHPIVSESKTSQAVEVVKTEKPKSSVSKNTETSKLPVKSNMEQKKEIIYNVKVDDEPKREVKMVKPERLKRSISKSRSLNSSTQNLSIKPETNLVKENIVQKSNAELTKVEPILKKNAKKSDDKNVDPLLKLENDHKDKIDSVVNKIVSSQARVEAALQKAEGELMITKRLRSTADQLQQEYSSLKKILESERSAFREYKALQEAESRKERAEAKRREAALEGQLRSALKGSPPVCRGPSKLGPADCEVAKLSQSLHAAKSEMKGLQEKLQMVTEADKRKAGELRAQHDANVAHVQQMERDVRAQTAKLLEELKSKERHLEQVRKAAMGALGARGGQGGTRGAPNKMAVADQLHMMESQISRLESELQRRDDIIQTLRTSKLRRDRQLMAQRQSKENLYKDTMSDVDSAVSSAPNSLSPQPSPDLWFRSHDGLQGEVDEAVLEMAKKQIQELEKALSISAAGQRSAQQRAAQLEEQLQDLREQADLLEFRCLELEDTSEKRNAIEELTDSDSGCTSPEHRLKNSVSPQLRRSDSGYKSPTLCPNSPNLGNHRVLTTPPSEILEINPASSLYKSQIDALHLRDIDSVFDGGDRNGDVRDRLERMLLKSHSEEDRSCLEQVLQLMWNLQALSINISDNYSKVKNKRVSNGEIVKNDVDNTNRSSKIIATISPYSQTSLKAVDLQKSSDFDEPDFVNILIKEESKKLLSGLQESGIFEEADWETKGTQTDWCDCICNEPESDLATEVQRLNQIREQLEKSGAIRNKSFKNRQRSNDSVVVNDKVDAKRREKTFYENRIAILEDKISIYESSDDIKEKKLVQRLQVEVDLQAKIDILESDLDIIKQRYEILEEERCEFEEAENDTRLHCQELEAEFELLSAKLRDMDEQRGCSKNEAACYRALVQEYEDKSAHLQAHVADLLRRLEDMEDAASAIIFWQIYKIIEPHPEFDFKAAFHARFPDQVLPDDNESQTGEDENNSMTSFMVCQEEYNPLECIEKQLESLLQEKIEIHKNYKRQVDLSKKDMAALEKTIMENGELLKKQEEKSRWKIEMLERELKQLQDVVSSSDSNSDDDKTDDELKKKIQSLTGIINEQRQRIDELKKREVAFLATLTQGDEMWAEMESTYKQKVKEFEENEAAFKEEIDKAKAEIHKWKGKFELSEQKVHELEYKEVELEKIIEKLDRDSKDAVSQNSVLNNENQNLRSELLSSKSSMQELEANLKNELSMQKKTSEKIQEELSLQSKHSLETIKEHKQKVSSLKTELSKSLKDWSELEVTNNELKKEVHTLDTQLQEITNKMIRQSSEYEEKIQLLHEELSNKCKEAEQMQREIEQSQSLPSAHEELKEVDEATSKHYGETSDPENINQHIDRTALSPVQIKPSSDMCTCTHIEKSTQTDEITRASVDESSSGSYFSCDCCTQTNAPEQIQEIQSSESTNRQSTSEMNASKTTQDVFSQTSQEVLTDKDKVREKPALPERKPKLPARSNSKLKIDEQKKRLSRAGVSGTRSQEESIKKLSKDLTNNLMNILDSQTCLAEKSKMVEGSDGKTPSVEDSVSGIGSDKAEIENNFCKIIRESFDSYLEGVKSSAHRQLSRRTSELTSKSSKQVRAEVDEMPHNIPNDVIEKDEKKNKIYFNEDKEGDEKLQKRKSKPSNLSQNYVSEILTISENRINISQEGIMLPEQNTEIKKMATPIMTNDDGEKKELEISMSDETQDKILLNEVKVSNQESGVNVLLPQKSEMSLRKPDKYDKEIEKELESNQYEIRKDIKSKASIDLIRKKQIESTIHTNVDEEVSKEINDQNTGFVESKEPSFIGKQGISVVDDEVKDFKEDNELDKVVSPKSKMTLTKSEISAIKSENVSFGSEKQSVPIVKDEGKISKEGSGDSVFLPPKSKVSVMKSENSGRKLEMNMEPNDDKQSSNIRDGNKTESEQKMTVESTIHSSLDNIDNQMAGSAEWEANVKTEKPAELIKDGKDVNEDIIMKKEVYGEKSRISEKEPVAPEGRMDRNIQLKSVADKIQVSQSDVQYDTIKALKKAFEPEEDYSGVYTVRSIGHSFSDRPIPAPRGNSHKAHNGVKKAESFSETTKLHSLPFIQEKFSNQDLSYTPATLNTTTDALKCSLKSTEGEPLKLFVPYHNQNAPKSLGSLVYERVAKITNEMNINNSTVPQLISLKRSVSMTADNKSITGKNVYIYNDL